MKAGVGLTPRQYAVLELIWKGWADKVIAAELHMSPRTVRAHNQQIFLRLGVQGRVQAAIAFERGHIVKTAYVKRRTLK